jgi:hypothetical protein
MRVEGTAQGLVVGGHGLATAHHDQIERANPSALLAEALPDEALEAVAVDGTAGLLASDRESEAGAGAVVTASREYREVGVGGSRRPGENPRERCGV